VDASLQQRQQLNKTMSGKNWLLHTPRFPDNLSWTVLELKNIFDRNNTHCEIIDINHAIYKEFFNTSHWENIDNFGIMNRGKIPLFKITRIVLKELRHITPNDRILINVFSTESRSWCELFCAIIKRFHNNKIFIGGNGVYAPGEGEDTSEWADYLLEYKLVDAAFLNQADETLQDAIACNFNIQGKIYKVTKTFPKLGFLPSELVIDPIEKQRVYDSTYIREDLDHPAMQGGLLDIEWAPKVHFTLGCVKQCTFCDIPVLQPWVMRDVQEVLDEFKHYVTTTGKRYFFLGDSTINGSTSAWMKLLEGMYKLQQEIGPIYWNSQIAVKPANRSSEEQFELMGKTNFHASPGMDHVSDRVLHDMNKKYTWEDVLYWIDMFDKHNVWIRDCLWIVGYPTEQEQDFNEYSKLLKRLQSKNTFVSHIVNVCYINKNSPLLELVDIDWNNPNSWTSKTINNTQQIRLARKEKLDNDFEKLGKLKYKLNDTYKRALR
jgi:hypothetical protein